MADVTVTFGRLAEIALSVSAQAQIKADDETIELVRASRRFLRAIVSGDLIVSQPAPAAPPPSGRPCPGSEGVVPAPAQPARRRK